MTTNSSSDGSPKTNSQSQISDDVGAEAETQAQTDPARDLL